VKRCRSGIVDVYRSTVVGHRFDALLHRQYLIVTSHHDNGAELQANRTPGVKKPELPVDRTMDDGVWRAT